MGKYATYRKRGGGGSSTTALGPPPAPQLEVAAGALLQTSNDNEWNGGLLNLYSSPTGNPPWDFEANAAAEAVHSWGGVGGFSEAAYHVTEVGNGIDFLGESAPSIAIELPP